MREWLKKARKEAGLTCSQTAERLGMSEIYYQFIESGRRQPKMYVETAVKLSKVLRLPIQSIIDYETR